MVSRQTPYQIVIDTNVLISGLRSKRGASYQLLRRLRDTRWQVNISVALVLEYEAVLSREREILSLSLQQIHDTIDGLCAIANQHTIYYLWRPRSPDPGDDFLIELAVRAGADFILSYNQRDLQQAVSQFDIEVITPKQFLQRMGELP